VLQRCSSRKENGLPNPLSQVKSRATVVAGNAGRRALSQRPGLAVLAMEALGSWSNVESFLLQLFVELLGGNASIAAQVYMALPGNLAKSAALNVAIEAVTDPRVKAVLKAVIAVTRPTKKLETNLRTTCGGFHQISPRHFCSSTRKAW
jgi:hypothetical protein